MCGIIGYTGHKNALSVILPGLESLCYRGYDSAGVCTIENDGFFICKCVGDVDALKRKIQESCIKCKELCSETSNVGIGHTRWATHGAVTDSNSHPHGTDLLQLVHNGVIENHRELREELCRRGYSMASETDTECVAKLCDMYYRACRDPLMAIVKTVDRLKGSFALAVIFKEASGAIYAVRRGSPLLIGITEEEGILASDLTAIAPLTKKYLRMEDGAIAKIEGASCEFYDFNGNAAAPPPIRSAEDEKTVSKDGYSHFMRREIADIPACIQKTEETGILLSPELLMKIQKTKCIHLIGCGTAYHAGVYGAKLCEALLGIRSIAHVASEFRYGKVVCEKDDIFLLISQSGETADTLACLSMLKERRSETIALVNVKESTLAHECENVILTHAGREISVASTKAYTAQCVSLSILFSTISEKGKIGQQAIAAAISSELSTLPRLVDEIFQEELKIIRLSDAAKEMRAVFFLGAGFSLVSAMEGSLKLKEISYLFADAYAAGELKHGTISLIEKGTLVIAPIGEEEKTKLATSLHEVASRGATTAAIGEGIFEEADISLPCPKTHPYLAPILQGVILQLFAYHTARLRGCPIDRPRNLAKSVTVE